MTQLIQMIGSPFVNEDNNRNWSDADLISNYENAFVDRVALLYLSKYRRNGWAQELEDKYNMLENRRLLTLSVISTLAEKLNTIASEKYVIFKSIKPYPATPNDTDVLFTGNRKLYKDIFKKLLDDGYIFHEWAPQQKTVYDPRGIGKIGHGKKGGTYYIDLYEEISTDYFAYLNKRHLSDYIFTKEINNIPVNLLKPEPELAIVLFHNVFPERTFQLEHFYYPLYSLANQDFDLDLFVHFAQKNHLIDAVRANLSLISSIHENEFNNTPDPINKILKLINKNEFETSRFEKLDRQTPHLFSKRLFAQCFFRKLSEWYSLKTALWQLLNLFNPKFFLDVINSIRLRLGEKSVYNLEK